MKEYVSIEEFTFINKRYPNVEEAKQLYGILWNKYIENLDENSRKIAIENSKIQNQVEIKKRIAISTERFKKILRNERNIISISYDERWGAYSIGVVVNCLSRKNLYRFRKYVPNFFEGWEVRLIPFLGSFLQTWRPLFIFIVYLIIVIFLLIKYIHLIGF